MPNETKHTPGPWTNHKWNCDEHQISALGGTVALISHSHARISEESADANARLIAAAPELLEALEWIVEEQGHGADCNRRTNAACECNYWKAKAYAAIAKAEGKEI